MDINNLLKTEAGRIGAGIHRKGLATNLWNALIKQDKFPEQQGNVLSVLTYERSLPRHSAAGNGNLDTTGLKWQAITTETNAATNPPYGFYTEDSVQSDAVKNTAEIEFRTSMETYSLQRAFVESPRFDVEDLRIAVHRQDQLGKIVEILTENTIYAWMERYRSEYMRLAKYAIVLDGSPDYSALNTASLASPDPFNGFAGGAANVNFPTQELQQTHLDRLHTRMVLNGAAMHAYGKERGRPVFALITSAETSDNIMTALGAETGVRADFRESTRVNELLAPFGIERSYRGYFHLVDDLCPRYESDGAASPNAVLERIEPYVRDAGTGAWDLNPDYETASYELAIIFNPGVYTSLMLAPTVATGSKFKFDAVNFKGDFRFVNILSEDKNPDGTNGYFRGILASASKPERREFGVLILHKRGIFG